MLEIGVLGRSVAGFAVLDGFSVGVGIMFQDITTLLLDPKAFRDTIDIFVERYRDQEITVIAGNRVHSILISKS